MRVFWAIILVLAGVTALLFARPGAKDADGKVQGEPIAFVDGITTDAMPATPEPVLDESVRQTPIEEPDESKAQPTSTGKYAPKLAEPAGTVEPETIEPEPVLEDEKADELFVDSQVTDDVLTEEITDEVVLDPVVTQTQRAQEDNPEPLIDLELEALMMAQEAQAAAAESKEIPATFETQEDGAVLVDDRFIVYGKGTQENPYEITWEHLIATGEVYQPRSGKDKLPEAVTFLDGKWVRLEGYIAFPLELEQPDEVLLMINQWDGCCIGIPPTPFDAIEVKLDRVVNHDERFADYAELTGVLRVDPYLSRGFLLGLYLMDDAEIKVIEGGGGF